jgi:hypothetical protein
MTIELGRKKFSIDGVPVRALAEMDEAWDMYGKLVKAAGGQDGTSASFRQVIESLARWIVILFKNQFTLDELMDNYPSDRFIIDAGVMLGQVAGRITEGVKAFPTTARSETQTSPTGALRSKFMGRFGKTDVRLTK